MRSTIAAALLGLACLLPGQDSRHTPGSDAKLFESAQRLRWRGEEAAAQARMRELLERKPDHFEARTFLGHQFFKGRWRLPEEIAYLRRAERRAAGTPDAAPPAPPANVAAADREPFFIPRRPPARQPASVRGRGLFSLRLQNVRLLGMDTVPVSFGNGSGRLQLPRTQSVSFGGPVWLPLGFGF